MAAFFSIWAVVLCVPLSTRSVFVLIGFTILWLLYRRILSQNDLHLSWPVCLGASLLTLSHLLAQHGQITSAFTSKAFQGAALFITALGLFSLYCMLLGALTLPSVRKWLQTHVIRSSAAEGVAQSALQVQTNPLRRHMVLFTFLLCLICWLPYLLYEFPGVLSPDSIVQMEQVQGMRPLSNHHPIVHTLLISLFWHIGMAVTGDATIAVSFYTIAQMLFMAFCASYVVRTLQHFSVRFGVLLCTALIYALVPFNALLSVCVWKDVPFAGVCTLLVCTIAQLLSAFRSSIPIPLLLRFCVLCILFGLLRGNGWYAFLLMAPLLLLTFRTGWKKILLPLLSAVMVCGVIRGPVMNAKGVEQHDFIESCSIPLQQIARVITEGGTLTDSETALISSVVDISQIPEYYTESISDNMKELVRAGNEEYLTAHKKEFFRLWLSLMCRYPGTYLEAWVQETKGYWFPDISYDVAEIDGVVENDCGISWHPLLTGGIVVRLREIGLKLGSFVPFYSLLWSIGSYSYLLLICLVLLLHDKKGRERTALLLPSLTLLFTLWIATPVATEFRYAFCIVFSAPMWAAAPFIEDHPRPSS